MPRGSSTRTKQPSREASEEVSSRAPRHATNLLLTVLPLAAAFLTAGGVFLHTIGAIAHRTFLGEMGVPPGLFPKDAAWTLINGYYALFDRWFLLFKVFTDETGKFVLYSFVTTVVVLAYWLLLRWQPKSWNDVKDLSAWLRGVIRFFTLATAIVGTIPGAVCAVLLLIIVVGAPGEYAGKAQAAKLKDRYAKGCALEAPCTTALRAETVAMTGAVLDASPNHIAIYDPRTKLSHVIEMEGNELRQFRGEKK